MADVRIECAKACPKRAFATVFGRVAGTASVPLPSIAAVRRSGLGEMFENLVGFHYTTRLDVNPLDFIE